MWLELRMQFIGVAMVTSVAFIAVFEHNFSTISSGLYIHILKAGHSVFIFGKTYRKSRCISRVFETTNRAKLLDLDLYTKSKSIRSMYH